ncbi:MAG: hypothetical protein D6731_21405 [Planctomycetota bacterium]|nr:MAG: hypothetical protein D6731_21405 [Planctomycetota bacterium]
MPARRRVIFALPFACASLLIGAQVGANFFSAQAAPERKRKLTLREWKKKMRGWSRAIGKKCNYCHVKDGEEFDYEADTPNKRLAHYCEEHFVEKLLTKAKRPVTCATCHPKRPSFLPREGGRPDSAGDGDEADRERD